MTTTTNVKQVKLNVMTQAQYNSATKNPTELYMITDAPAVTVDSALSTTSENPVQNKVVTNALNGKVAQVSTANKVYGTDASGNQTTYNKSDFGGVSDVKVGTTSVVTNTVANLGTMAGENTTSYYNKSTLDTSLGNKVDKVVTANKVYGTDASGNQTTYNKSDFGGVSDVKVGTTSVVTNTVANLGTMAGETASNYSTKAVADTLYAAKSVETSKVDKISTASKIYGTDSSGSQTTYNVSDLTNAVTDVKVGTSSVVTNKIATLGTMAGENTTNYYKKTDMAAIATSGSWNNLSNTPTTISGYGITDAYTKTEIDGKLASAMHFKGTKATVSALPSSGQQVGDMWNVTENGANYAWDGSAWDKLSETIDLSGLQPLLVSGTNIKTINNTSILGSGNINITKPSIATTSVAGIVKPDGTTITITNDGTISAQSGAAITFRTWSD